MILETFMPGFCPGCKTRLSRWVVQMNALHLKNHVSAACGKGILMCNMGEFLDLKGVMELRHTVRPE